MARVLTGALVMSGQRPRDERQIIVIVTDLLCK